MIVAIATAALLTSHFSASHRILEFQNAFPRHGRLLSTAPPMPDAESDAISFDFDFDDRRYYFLAAHTLTKISALITLRRLPPAFRIIADAHIFAPIGRYC
jgi:hypothetical protein